MAGSNLTASERRAVNTVMDTLTVPSFELLLDGDHLGNDGMRPGTARELFRPLIGAAVELQAGGEQPIDKAFARYDGPPPGRVRRFLEHLNLEPLPQTQLLMAVDAGEVDPPESIIVESRAEPVTGPDKFGALHVHPPPDVAVEIPRIGVPHKQGGVATALTIADCGTVVLPCGGIQLAQGYWHPAGYPATIATRAGGRLEAELRERGEFYGEPFTRTPNEIVTRVMQKFNQVKAAGRWTIELDGLTLTGGRMRMGYPVTSGPVYGAGGTERHLGCDLEGLCDIRDAGFVAFFVLPLPGDQALGGQVQCDRCEWEFQLGGTTLDLADVERLRAARHPAWLRVDPELVSRNATLGTQIWRVALTASADGVEAVPLQLVLVVDEQGRRELFVTTIAAHGDEHPLTERLVKLAARETGRLLLDSPVEAAICSLLRDGHAQTNQRRRFPDRRSFLALAQTACGVLQLARRPN